MTNIFLDIVGDARAFIAPFTNINNILTVLRKLHDLNEAAAQAAEIIWNEWSTAQQQQNPQKSAYANRQIFFKTISLYSKVITENPNNDFLGTFNLFQEITEKLNGFVVDKLNPSRDQDGNPYQGYEFRLLDSVLKLLIMFNNVYIYGNTNAQSMDVDSEETKVDGDGDVVMTGTDLSLSGGAQGTKRGRETSQQTQEQQQSPRSGKRARTINQQNFESLRDNSLLVTRLNSVIPYDIQSIPQGIQLEVTNLQGYSQNPELIKCLVNLINLSKPGRPLEMIRRELMQIIDTDIKYSQSDFSMPFFITPQIKLLIALAGIQSFLFVKNNNEREEDSVFMLLFANKDAIAAGTTIDFAWNNWDNGQIMQRFYVLLQRIEQFQDFGIYNPLTSAATITVQGGNKTRKKRKRNRKTRKAKKKRQNKRKKTRVKRDKRKRKKTRGRKKKN